MTTTELAVAGDDAGPLTWLPYPLQQAWFGDKLSPETREAYLRDGWHWLSWCRQRGIDPLQATSGATRAWIDDQRHGWCPPKVNRRPSHLADGEATIARRLASLSTLYRVLRGEGVTQADPLANVTRPRSQKAAVRRIGLGAHKIKQLLAVADDHSPRMAALIWLLVDCGLRISEALGTDVDTSFSEHEGHRLVTVMGKGRIERTVAVPPGAWHRIQTYAGDRTGGPLFLSNRFGRRWHRVRAYEAVRNLGPLLVDDEHPHGIKLHPHLIRHSTADLAAEAGEDLVRIQTMLGHADLNTTAGYLHARRAVRDSSAYAVERLLNQTPLTQPAG